MMHSKSCRKLGVPERLPLDPAAELEHQVVAHSLNPAVLAAVVAT